MASVSSVPYLDGSRATRSAAGMRKRETTVRAVGVEVHSARRPTPSMARPAMLQENPMTSPVAVLVLRGNARWANEILVVIPRSKR